ncbi:hypothetical protein BZA70DRAFT_280388 [Myxozyma melibiosi]|uniref:Ubiquitin-like protease family profile domain-containing protein n=1 Tax=Myxozyma melibiosi TaxID=54550 RepID=A0ABR1F363_9ASCO
MTKTGTSKRSFKLFSALVKLLKMRSTDIILEYFDVSVYKEDFDNLREEHWLNDNNLTFWYEYLERSESFVMENPGEIVLLRPSMVFLLAQSSNPKELKDVLPSMDDARYVFLPINDNDDVDLAEGGSHWSLLIVDRQIKRGFYYDTLDDSNVREAENVAKKLSILDDYATGKFTLYSLPTPQQTNGSDCGVMVCMLTSHFLRKIVEAQASDSGDEVDWHVGEQLMSAKHGRQLLSYTILDLITKHGRKIGYEEECKKEEILSIDESIASSPGSNAAGSDSSESTMDVESELVLSDDSSHSVDIMPKALKHSYRLHLHRKTHRQAV